MQTVTFDSEHWQVVPIKVTDEMLKAWFDTPRAAPFRSSRQYFQDCYAAMITAAPPAPGASQADLAAMNEMRMNAERYLFLCCYPNWGFVEDLCRQFAAESASEFKAGLDAAIAKRWNMDPFLEYARDAMSQPPEQAGGKVED